jgi:hypothetical protein
MLSELSIWCFTLKKVIKVFEMMMKRKWPKLNKRSKVKEFWAALTQDDFSSRSSRELL